MPWYERPARSGLQAEEWKTAIPQRPANYASSAPAN